MQKVLTAWNTHVYHLKGQLRAPWFLNAVLAPFLWTRLAWILAAAFARGSFEPNPTYLKYAQQGGIHTRVFLLDIFAHWDAGYYLTIIKDGYWGVTDLAHQYSNVAFYPLYPYLVKSIGWLGIPLPTAGYLIIGLLLSNICFLASAVLLYRLAVERLGMSDTAAQRALILMFVYPASFIFSCFYTESLFLLLTLLGFKAALDHRWWQVGLVSGLLVLTRAQGLVVVGILGLIYLEEHQWKIKTISADILWFGLAPLALGAHLFYLYGITGNFLAPYQAVQAWGRTSSGFLTGILDQVSGSQLDVYKIDLALILFFLVCGFYMLRKFPRIFGIYTLLLCLLPLSTGLLASISRYIVVVFPVYLLLGKELERHDNAYKFLAAIWFTLQVLYFAGWANYYWIV